MAWPERSVAFSIPHRRELTGEERRILSLLLADRPDYAARIDRLKVVARCGCGECPTVMFGESLDSDPVESGYALLAEFTARSESGLPVDLLLWEKDGRLVSLEAVGYAEDIARWPVMEPFGTSGPGGGTGVSEDARAAGRRRWSRAQWVLWAVALIMFVVAVLETLSYVLSI